VFSKCPKVNSDGGPVEPQSTGQHEKILNVKTQRYKRDQGFNGRAFEILPLRSASMGKMQKLAVSAMVCVVFNSNLTAQENIANSSVGGISMKEYSIANKKAVLEKDVNKYLSFPQLAKIGEDKILMIYREDGSNPDVRCHGKGIGDIKYMFFENGKWGKPALLYKHEEGAYEYMACDPTVLKDGSVLLHSREYFGSHRNYVADFDRVKGVFSEKRFFACDEFAEEKLALFGKVIELESGDLLLGVYGVDKELDAKWKAAKRTDRPVWSAACHISSDKGKTWKFNSWITRARDSQIFEPVMVKLNGSSIYCLLRTNLGYFTYSISEDNGKTWAKPKKAFPGVAATGLRLSSGELMMLYRGNEKCDDDKNAFYRLAKTGKKVGPGVILYEGKEVRDEAVYKGKLFVCRFSTDDGKTWSKELEIDDHEAVQGGSFGMGDAVELKDGSIKVVYYTSDKDQAPWIEECVLVPKK